MNSKFEINIASYEDHEHCVVELDYDSEQFAFVYIKDRQAIIELYDKSSGDWKFTLEELTEALQEVKNEIWKGVDFDS